MNKIKAKINSDDFSPWEDSFNNLLQTTQQISKRKKRLFSSLDGGQHKSNSIGRQKSKEKGILTRTFMNISKINLNDSSTHKQQTIEHNQSRRYAGPRATFYAQMNPKINGKTRPILDHQEYRIKQKRYSFKNEVISRMVKGQSIKYLEIIQQNSPQLTHRQSIGSFINRPTNLKRIGVIKARVSDEHHSYLRRLRMIYKNR